MERRRLLKPVISFEPLACAPVSHDGKPYCIPQSHIFRPYGTAGTIVGPIPRALQPHARAVACSLCFVEPALLARRRLARVSERRLQVLPQGFFILDLLL